MTPLTDAERAAGMALLRYAGMPDYEANDALDTDPECQRVARAVAPVLQRLVSEIADVAGLLEVDA